MTLWIVACAAAVAYLAGGLSLLLMSRDRYRSLADSQRWVDDFSDGHLKAIAAIKLTGAGGLLVPALVPLAACGMALFMAGAATTRFRRSEWNYLAGDIAFLAMFVFLAWGRFMLPVR
ncbi:DoxX family protein [Mycobacterium sp. NPDC003323]